MDNNNTSLLKVAQVGGLLNERITSMLLVLNWSVIGAVIAVFGIAANIINIIVFIKMGVRESVNLSLMCLSLSDLGSLVVLAMISLISNPLFTSLDLPFIYTDVIALAGGWPWTWFVRTSGMITTFVTMERCLCIKAPLRVRTILTPTRTAISLAAIFLLLLLSLFPVLAYTDLAPIFDPRTNKTLIGVVFNDKEDAMKPFVMIPGFIVTAGSFLCVCVFSLVLIHALIQRRRKWKSSKNSGTSQTGAAPSTGKTQTQNKEIQVAKMILLVAAVFLVCFVPLGSLFLTMELVPGFYMGKTYNNIYLVCMAVIQNLQGVNSSINIVLYLNMSSKFRQTIRAMFLSLKQTTEPKLD
ncbi:putative G-protein coupled receptor F59B2.13 [Aplysia californica]|uniref:G-protein coupled receptor F59B2.13 n=1 Tax=Aplysia californica TaxID=6500 RepID=A0ABM0K5C0_APLCA|nr:putative G-protein coupled receptor F59B2.13 [Aplysia californica]